MKILAALWAVFLGSGCNLLPFYSHQNRPLDPRKQSPCYASLDVAYNRGNNEEVLVLLALSGGGSRAAYLSASVMWKLQTLFEDIDLLKEVDVISSVSGGSLPAAYYCITDDPGGPRVRLLRELQLPPELERARFDPRTMLLSYRGPMGERERDRLKGIAAHPRDRSSIDLLHQFTNFPGDYGRLWSESRIKSRMSRNYLARWLGRWLWPWNIIRYWTTKYDRSDIMAKVLADNLFDRRFTVGNIEKTGNDLKFRHLKPERPYLILNATDGTENVEGEDHFSKVFTFTHEDFVERLGSDIRSYKIANAVMASAAFPAVFNYVTLRDYREREKSQFLHVFDGGNSDNLGLQSIQRVILDCIEKGRPYRQYVVILIDAFTEPVGIDRNLSDPRGFFSYVVDFNFLDTMNCFLNLSRNRSLDEFNSKSFLVREEDKEKLRFFHIGFVSSERGLKKRLNRIPTSFSISRKNVEVIDEYIDRLFTRDNPMLLEIRKVLLDSYRRQAG